MKDFISEYITSLTSRQRINILGVLAASTVEKESLDVIASKLSNIKKNAPLSVQPEAFNATVDAGKIDGTYRDSYRRLSDLFDASNLVSLLLDSYNTVLISEIKALEDELNSIEKAISNYAFTLSDNGFYNYSFTETFNDDTMRETSTDIKLTDRSGVEFGTNELAAINGVSGTLTLNPELKIRYALTGSILTSNCYSLVTSDSGLENAFNPKADVGWRIAISSPKPISTSLPGTEETGAQVKLELILTSAIPCDTLLFTPFSDIPTEILSVLLYKTVDQKEADALALLDTSLIVDKPTHIGFPSQPVAKVEVILNQSTFTRSQTPANKYEEIYRSVSQTVKDQNKKTSAVTFKTYNKNKKALRRIFLKTQTQDEEFKFFKSAIPEIDFEVRYGPMTIDRIINGTNGYGNRSEMWNYQSDLNNHFRQMIHESVFSSNQTVLNDTTTYSTVTNVGRRRTQLNTLYSSGLSQEYPRIQTAEPTLSAEIIGTPILNESIYLNYNYNIGMRDIQIGSGDRIFRGFFISKQIPAETDSGEVKLKADEVNYRIIGTSKDTGIVTSIEYCVSNQSNPQKEEDWLPILPIDTDTIVGERFFVNDGGSGYLRFSADPSGTFIVYKNGYIIDKTIYEVIKSTDQSSTVGLKIPMNIFLNTDIFTIDYTPVSNQQIVNFIDKGFGQSLLASAYDDKGAGESFPNSADNQVISLKFNPYVNYDAVQTLGVYSSSLGFTGAYQPITIVMADGIVALNQTNYRGTIQNNLATFDSTKIAYLHSGKNITFNQPIDTPFTVFYQYIPSNLRFRVILRVNSSDFVSPVVNSIQIKTKTLKSDPRKAF